MRACYLPGATPLERLETYLAYQLRCRPEAPGQVAHLLIRATRADPERGDAIQAAFTPDCLADAAETLGMARAVLVLGGASPEQGAPLTGDPRRDLAQFMSGRCCPPDPACPPAYAGPKLLHVYCHMGAGFARGVDRVFRAVTGRPLVEHLGRALDLLEPAV